MHSILPTEWRVLIPKNRVTSDMFLTALYEYSGKNTNSDDTDVVMTYTTQPSSDPHLQSEEK